MTSRGGPQYTTLSLSVRLQLVAWLAQLQYDKRTTYIPFHKCDSLILATPCSSSRPNPYLLWTRRTIWWGRRGLGDSFWSHEKIND